MTDRPAQEIADPIQALPLLDRSVTEGFRELMGADFDSFAIDIVNTYCISSSELIAIMADALENDERGIFQRSAHTLKSSSAQIGALRVAELARAMEEQAKMGTLDGAAPMLESTLRAFQLTCETLSAVKVEIKAAGFERNN
ncbi:MAG: Hpt domain-containing protein [Anaerolineaceae bacterium]